MGTISGNPFEMAKDAANTVTGGVGNANGIIGTTEDLKNATKNQDSASILRFTAAL
ncbi:MULTISPECIES: hypothetical protein [Psychrobacter]|uniref:hypothetical protein n=1 Tax=Psychrobacter TaxID=497 RepID=UPI0018CEEBF4|nr:MULTISPECIES: hypothetical protein [Psychrobacter]MBH0064271.1 hypothetical protein [Psychrobacter sp. SZ93C1]MBH0086368.1 hypothetical protein [Psychrobacter sp. SCQQ22]